MKAKRNKSLTINKNEITVTTWIELQELLFKEKDTAIDRFRSSYAYRGDYDASHGLVTSIQRMGRKPSDFEDHLIRNFKKYSPLNLLNGEYNNLWNWIALGQHYGLPTRLLDWTFSPNVALHFMADFEKGFAQDGAIWMIDFIEMRKLMPTVLRDKILSKSYLTFTSPELSSEIGNTIDEVKKFTKDNGNFLLFMEPPSIDDRIINQFALFSFMLDPDSNKLDWLNQNPQVYKKIIIPKILKWEIRDKLDQANISERIIYPGLEGISKWLKRWYSEKNETKRWKV